MMEDSWGSMTATAVLSFTMFLRVFCSPKIQGILYNSVVSTFRLSSTSAGFMFSLMNATSFMLAPIGNLLLRYLPFRLNMSIGIVISGVFLSSVSFANSSIVLAICFTGVGIGLSVQLPNIVIYLSAVCGKSYPFYMSVVSSATSIGIFLLPPVVQFLLASYGVFGSYLLMGALMLNGIPAICLLRSKVDLGTTKDTLDSNSNGLLKSLKLFISPTDSFTINIALATTVFLHQFSYFAFNLYIIPFAEAQPQFHTSTKFISLIASVSGAGGIIGKLMAIVVFYFLSKTPTNVLILYTISCLVTTITLSLYTFLKSFSVWLLLTFMTGMMIHLQVSMINGIVSFVVTPEAFPYAIGSQCFLYGAGEITSGILSGGIYEACNCYEALFYVLAGCSALKAMVMIVITIAANMGGEDKKVYTPK